MNTFLKINVKATQKSKLILVVPIELILCCSCGFDCQQLSFMPIFYYFLNTFHGFHFYENKLSTCFLFHVPTEN